MHKMLYISTTQSIYYTNISFQYTSYNLVNLLVIENMRRMIDFIFFAFRYGPGLNLFFKIEQMYFGQSVWGQANIF